MLKILALTATTVALLSAIMASWARLPTIDEWKTWSLEELEKQMSPSRWNPVKSAEQVIDEFVRTTTEGTAKARQSTPNKLDVSYGSLQLQKFDIYGTELGPHAPILLWIHGGYWQEGSKDASGHFANILHSLGFRFIVLGYTLAPNANIYQMQSEVIAALKTAETMYPNAKFVVGGHSAGAHLASSLLTGEALTLMPSLVYKLLGLYLVSGVYDLRPLVNTYVNKPLQLSPTTAQGLSPLFQEVKEGWSTVPLKNLIVMGNHDSPEFKRQSTGYYELIKSEFHTEFWVSEADDHFSVIQKLMNEVTPSCKTLQQYLTQFLNVV